MNNILKVTAYSIGAAALSYAGWYLVSSKAENICENYKMRISSIKKSIIKLEAKISILNVNGPSNCYSTNKVLYNLFLTKRFNYMTEDEMKEFLIFDDLFNELISNKDKLKNEMKNIFELSRSYKDEFLAYECFNLDIHILKGEREIEALTVEFDELMSDNYLRFCNRLPFSDRHLKMKEIELGIND